MVATRSDQQLLDVPVWHDSAGQPLGCLEKIKVLNENLDELLALSQDALEDAVLMGGDEKQIRSVLHAMIDALHNPYAAGQADDA